MSSPYQNKPMSDRDACALEALGHLRQKVCLMWGSAELDMFITRLIMDSRDGQRQGLPLEVGAELLFLAQINKIIRAIDLLSHQNISLKEAYWLVDAGDRKRLAADLLDNPLVSRDTSVHHKPDEFRPIAPRREPVSSRGSPSSISRLFGLLFSKAGLFLVAVAVMLMLAWPHIQLYFVRD